MCLGRVIKILEPSDPKVRIGYKVFRMVKGNIYPQFYGDKKLQKKRWLKATEKILITDITNEKYSSGFHIFTQFIQAREWANCCCSKEILVVRRVKYKNTFCFGIQEWREVAVAKNILIDREVYGD